MTTEIVKIDPKQFGLTESKASEIEAMFKPMLERMTELEGEYNKIVAQPITPALVADAKALRQKYIKVRTGTAVIHKELKSFYLNGGRFVDGWKNAQLFASEGIENKLIAIEKYFENIEAERKAALLAERTEQLSHYTEVMPMGLDTMQDDVFAAYLASQKLAHEAKIEAERKAEADRIAAEKAEAEERERIRLENEALKLAAIEREKQAEAERKAQQAEIEKQRKESEAKQKAIEDAARLEREKSEAERAKLQGQLKAKADAEAKAKAEQERIEREKAKAIADATKAPDKIKLQRLVDGIVFPEIPQLTTDDSRRVASDLLQKFEAYKKWAVAQITQI